MMIKILKRLLIFALIPMLFTACGGGGGNSGDGDGDGSGSQNNKTAQLNAQLNTKTALIGVQYRNTSNDITGVTDSEGKFEYKESDTVIFTIAGKDYSINPIKTENDLLAITNSATIQNNLKSILLNLDTDRITSNGIDLTDINADIDPSLSAQKIDALLYKSTGVLPKLTFSPSLGINTEAPQGGADTAGMPMPFVDIFRTARPFNELIPPTATDANGWPTELDPDFNYTRTKLLQGTLKGAIPEGDYTFIYNGSGTLEFSPHGSINKVTKIAGENKYILNLKLKDFDGEDEAAASETNALSFNIKGIMADNYIKNIRIVMPGGTCTGNPFTRVNSQQECPDGSLYQSFSDRLEADRNAIIFNPDYLRFLRNFKTVRMMNLMEASLKKLCFTPDDCPAEVGTWEDRAKLSDVSWGGNDARTADKDHKGAPVEVMVALANTLKRDIWVNMPHVATDNYINQYAAYVYENLDSSLKVYVEYSNEVWNPGFAAHAYMIAKGKALNLETIPDEFAGSEFRGEDYFARLRYYSQRSKEIFALWETQFDGSTSRLQRILGSFIGDRVLTEQMLKHIDSDSVDAVAIAPYFFGCPYDEICIDADKNLAEATTVDDIFDIIDQSSDVDVKSLDGTIEAVKVQLNIIKQYNIKLVSYEGGQHLVTGVLGKSVNDDDRTRLRKLFNQANRDPRMKQRYITFLNGWKNLSDDGATLFTLYTLPQSYYRFGNFGLKEHLNMSRLDSPKYDGVMTFQENAGKCWWEGCSP